MLVCRIREAIGKSKQHAGKDDLLCPDRLATLCMKGWGDALEKLPKGDFCNMVGKKRSFCFPSLGMKTVELKNVSACLAYGEPSVA